MIQPPAFESSAASERPAPPRAKKHAGMIFVLSLLTLSNAFGLLLGIVGWADHGSRSDDELLRAAIFTTFLSAAALVALGGAWFTKLWGPRVYAATAVLGLIIGLANSQGAFSPTSLMNVAVAIGLWITAENNW
jgi:hypothetical protein